LAFSGICTLAMFLKRGAGVYAAQARLLSIGDARLWRETIPATGPTMTAQPACSGYCQDKYGF
jgi:hypothetical protein